MSKPNIDLNDYFCLQPFTYSEFHRKGFKETQFICCPDWNDINIRVSDNLKENWLSDEAQSIRDGHLNGNFKGCNPQSCPALNTLVNTGKLVRPLMRKEEYKPEIFNVEGPKWLKICSDNPCNLKCPTCRPELQPNTPKINELTNNLLKAIERDYGPSLETFFTSGGGDPFYSIPMREFLQNMDTEKFPNLDSIILHTNGILLTPKLWLTMEKVHSKIKMIEISIDAATKDTYENKTRLGGKWDTLMNNLEFLKTLETVDRVLLDFVVQQANFREMNDFVKMCYNIFNESKFKVRVNFQRVWQWPSISDERYKEMCVWDSSHRDYSNFITEISKLKKYTLQDQKDSQFAVTNNLNEFLVG